MRDIAKDKERLTWHDLPLEITDMLSYYMNEYEAAQAALQINVESMQIMNSNLEAAQARISELEAHIERIERKGYV